MSADIIPFKKPKKSKTKSQGMCQHGFHKWKIWQEKQFDTQKGKLVTVYKCSRCGEQKVKAH